MRFANKHVVITGVSQGIGLALAEAYRLRGARVAGIDLTQPAQAPEVFLQGDIADRPVLERFSQLVQSAFHRVDILINNAMLSRGGMDQCSYEDFLYVLRVGVAAPYYLTRLLAPLFSPGASVINLSSTRAFQSQANTESYSAAKGGITALTHSLAVSLAGKARVNAIAPGWIDTTGAQFPGADSAQHPAGRVGTPEDIVRAAFFLSGPEAGFITGQTLVVDGGMSRLMVYHGDGGWQLKVP
ncbi:MAG: SDR family oxidoreductase [Christensenellales bacterium]|jgi:NAD(P)-dependent dehydrogenase (short-subunit alcohol dehydrogenase family)